MPLKQRLDKVIVLFEAFPSGPSAFTFHILSFKKVTRFEFSPLSLIPIILIFVLDMVTFSVYVPGAT